MVACDNMGRVLNYWGCDGTSLDENRLQIQQLATRHSKAGQPVGDGVHLWHSMALVCIMPPDCMLLC